MEFYQYMPLPKTVQEDVLEKIKKDKEESNS
jgi:hypothetical protein